MRVWDRILLFVFSLIVTLTVFATMVYLVFGYQEFLPEVSSGEIIVLSVIIMIMSLRFLFYRSNQKSDKLAATAIVTRNDQGEIRITLDTIESLVLRAGKAVRGISDIHTRIRQSETGIRIGVRVIVEPDTEIPSTSLEIQAKVRHYVETLSGVHVEDVIVTIQDVRKPNLGKTRDLS